MKKKYLSILCIVLSLLVVLAGCGGNGGGSSTRQFPGW